MKSGLITTLGIMGMATMLLAEEQNPCETNYGWDPAPSLGAISAQPIDPLYINETLNYTPDWGSADDEAGTCVDSNGCESDESATLSVSYSWEIKKAGNVVKSGTGQTVTFDPSSTGLYDLHLTKEDTVSTNSCGPKNLSETDTVQFTVFKFYDIQIKHASNGTYWGSQEGGSGGGDIWTNQDFDYRARAEVGGNIDPFLGSEYDIQWIVEQGGLPTASGPGNTFTKSLSSTGSTKIIFYHDANGNLQKDSGEPAISINFSVVTLNSVGLTIKKHVDLPFYSASDADASLVNATTALQLRDRQDDLRVAVRLVRSGSVTNFGTSGDDLDTVDNSDEADAIFAVDANIKVVAYIFYCEGHDPADGCTLQGVWPENSIWTRVIDGLTVAHEYGHARGLSHSTSIPSHRIMYFGDNGPTVSVGQLDDFRGQ